MGYFGFLLLPAVACQVSRLSTVEAVALEGASLLLPFSILDLGDADQLIPVWQLDRVPLGVLELRYAHLCTLSSLSEASSAAQVNGNWSVVKASWGVRRVVALEEVLIIPLLSLFWDESSHLVVVPPSKDLVDSLLGDNTVDGPLL